MSASTLLTLADRAEAGNGPDRELDARVCAELGGRAVTGCFAVSGCFEHLEARSRNAPHDTCIIWEAPKVTSSIDVIEAIRSDRLPASEIAVSGSNNFVVTVWTGPADDQQDFGGYATTEPRARLAAVLRAIAGGVDG